MRLLSAAPFAARELLRGALHVGTSSRHESRHYSAGFMADGSGVFASSSPVASPLPSHLQHLQRAEAERDQQKQALECVQTEGMERIQDIRPRVKDETDRIHVLSEQREPVHAELECPHVERLRAEMERVRALQKRAQAELERGQAEEVLLRAREEQPLHAHVEELRNPVWASPAVERPLTSRAMRLAVSMRRHRPALPGLWSFAGRAHDARAGDVGVQLAVTWPLGLLAGSGLLACAAALFWLFRTPLEQGTAAQTVQATRKAISDATARGEAVGVSQETVQKVLESDDSVDRLIKLLRRLVAKDQTIRIVGDLLGRLYEQPVTIPSLRRLTSRILESEEALRLVAALLKRVCFALMDDDYIRRRAALWVSAAVRDTLGDGDVQRDAGESVHGTLPWPLSRVAPPQLPREAESPLEHNRKLEEALLLARLEIARLQKLVELRNAPPAS